MKKLIVSLLVASTLFTGVNGVFAQNVKANNGQAVVNQNVNTWTFEQMREEYYNFLVKHKIDVEPLVQNMGGYSQAYISISGGYYPEGSWVDGVFKNTGDTLYSFGIRGSKAYTDNEKEEIVKFLEHKFSSKVVWTESFTQADGKGGFVWGLI